MRATSLRQFLQSICFKSPWNYAVFWKLQHQFPAVLTWEDGYLGIPCASEPFSRDIGNCYRKSLNELLSPNCGSRSHNGYSGDHPIGLAVAEMSSTHYVAGKGAIGEVASLCIPRWIYANSVAPPELIFGSVECPHELLLQFVAGIQTILLVPCIPHGVLQLGSMETVAENMEMVTNLAGKFDAHYKFVNLFPGGESCEFFLRSTPSESVDIPSVTTMNKVKKDDIAADIPILEDQKWSTAFPMTSLFEVQDAFQLFGEHMPNAPENENESKMHMRHENMMIDLVKHLNHQHYDDNRSGITENSFGRSCHAKDVNAFSYYNCNDGGVDVFNEVDFYFDRDMLDQQTLGKGCSDVMLRNVSNSFSCPTECELYKALGSTVHNLSDFGENIASKLIYDDDRVPDIEPSFAESNGWCLEGGNAENLLGSLVAREECYISDDYSLYKMMDLEFLNMASGELAPSRKRKNQFTEGALVGDSTDTLSTLTFASAGADKYALTNLSRFASSSDCVGSAYNEGKHQGKFLSSPSRKESKVSNINKKRGRSGDSHRPRPRDRQLIQDRLKELRQLVPNGSKCSIDGLLDKTIKHMLFLQSVTNQADKLRFQAQKEIAPDKSRPQSTGVKKSYQQGTSWAVELGSEDQICPIMVKDLEYPGQMLIEMMCDDHARFLEVADVLHRLELMILKGVMEKRSESTWAHFIVEASGGCHRLDIFWPLMQLLQQVPNSVLRMT